MLPPRHQPIDHVLAPFRSFASQQASGGLLLMAAAIVALVAANSPLAEEWDALWHTELGFELGGMALVHDLHYWINDALMAIFFLLVGLEIKRELLVGELASRRQAILPAAAAIGGAVIPAAIFLAIVGVGTPEGRGWGVPMATDIAFALGVLALVGSRAPLGLRIFLTALAIVDDLLAVGVIALFYTSDLAVAPLGVAAAIVVALFAVNRLGVRRPVVYALFGIALWFAVEASGIHATVAGVLLALTVPSRTKIDAPGFVAEAREAVSEFERRIADETHLDEQHAALWELEDVTEHAQAPMLRMEHALQPWVAYAIVPLFALANAGVALGDVGALLGEPLVIGVLAGLVLGKPLGITAAAYAVVRFGWASLPGDVSWRQVFGAAWLGGIGFTMSLFVTDLAFTDQALVEASKAGILGASVLAGVVGFLILRLLSPAGDRDPMAEPAH